MSANVIKLTPSTLAALMCSRVCHDLINSVGMMNTGLEVLDDKSNPDMHEDAIELIRTSSRQANAKLNFLRDAFGAAGSAPGIIPLPDVQIKTEALFGGGKVNFDWQISTDSLPKGQARLLMNLIMLAFGAIPRGGDIVIKDTDGGTGLSLTATGRRAQLDPNIEKAMAGKSPEDGFDGRTIQPFYTGMIARELGGSVNAHIGEDTVAFIAKLAPEATA